MNPTRILVFAGSIRSGAWSEKLAAAATKEISLADTEVTHISLGDYPLPLYDGDLQENKGIPENATRLARQIAAHHGVFIATPEYNHSLPPLLKNALDWVSRIQHSGSLPYRHKVYGLGSSSDTRFGGARALVDLRKILVPALGAIVIPSRVEIPYAQNAFDESGHLIDEDRADMLRIVARQLVEFSRRMAND